MNTEATRKLKHLFRKPRAVTRAPLVEIEEVSVHAGELEIPSATDVSLALTHSSYSAIWRGPLPAQRKDIPAGAVSLCPFDTSLRAEIMDPSKFSVVLLRNEALEEARQENGRFLGADLRYAPHVKDPTLRQLMEILHRERQTSFRSGTFFLDSVAAALAGLLVANYSATAPPPGRAVGGMAPAQLRRTLEYIDAALGGEVRLHALAREVGLSASHFIRSFRASTGMTPYQFLLKRRVERAQSLLQDHRLSLTEVAIETGFADQHHLARTFRRLTNITPTDYRRSLGTAHPHSG